MYSLVLDYNQLHRIDYILQLLKEKLFQWPNRRRLRNQLTV